MKNIYRLVSGLFSSVLLAGGFIRAAEFLDPLFTKGGDVRTKRTVRMSWACVPCDFARGN